MSEFGSWSWFWFMLLVAWNMSQSSRISQLQERLDKIAPEDEQKNDD